MVPCDIPIVDFSPFLKEGDEDGKKNAMEVIRQACTEHGLFQIVNHGIPLDLMNQALEVTKTFFEFPDEEKLNCSNRSDLPLPAGYGCSAETSPEKYEYLRVCSPDPNCNLFSPNHPEISDIPIVDLSSFLKEADENGKKKAMDVIQQACCEHGVFQIVNHGVPIDLMKRVLELSRTFFGYSDEEKLKCSGGSRASLPIGYGRSSQKLPDKYEYLLMLSPCSSSYNVYPQNPPEFREVLENVFCCLSKTGLVMESILGDCLGLPPNFLEEFNHDRSCDIMSAKQYSPAYDNDSIGFAEHKDGNIFTFLFQDDVGGLQVHNNDDWVPVVPKEGTIVVNIGDVIQVLSNNKFKSAMHRVVRTRGRSRCSIAFFYSLQGDKWVEPLPQFTTEIGEKPLYRGFLYKDYQRLRALNKTNPPSRPDDVIDITHYRITT